MGPHVGSGTARPQLETLISLVAGSAALLLLLQASPQRSDTLARGDSALASCDGRRITAIAVDTRRPRFRGPLAIWRRAASSIGLHNTETHERVVRRYLTIEPGDTCTEFRRTESERLLRAQPFLATALVRAFPDGPTGARVTVETTDEVPALVAARYSGGDWALVLGNDNVLGTGMRILARAERRAHYRDGYGAAIEHRQMFGKPYVLGVEGVQYPTGERYVVDFGHAFLTDLQRIAWHTGAARRLDYVRLRSDAVDGATLTLPLRQGTWDVGGVLRFGPPRHTYLAGGVLTGERMIPAARTVLITDTGFVTAPEGELQAGAQYAPARSVRANAVGGYRNIRYTRANGVDALTGAQDLANGIQAGVIVGKSIPKVSPDDDGFLATHLFAGIGGERSYGAVQLDGEARRGFEEGEGWDAILGSGRAAWYFKPSRVFTSIVGVEWAGGWRSRFPFLLELGDRHGGVRGFGGSELAGARRGVIRVEERWIAGPVAGRGDLAFAVFGDAGRVWAGDAPYGVTTPLAAAVGFSVLAAVPAGGQRLFRADIAFPVRGPGRGGPELRLTVNDPTRHFWETPDDVMRARAAAIPHRIFGWP